MNYYYQNPYQQMGYYQTPYQQMGYYQQQPYGYPYGYMTPAQQLEKCKILYEALGGKTEEPKKTRQQLSPQELGEIQAYNNMDAIRMACTPISPTIEQCRMRSLYIEMCAQAEHCNEHSLFEFLNMDIKRMAFEEEMRLLKSQNRNLANTYDSNSYRELLASHNSLYDNNSIYDVELGMMNIPKFMTDPEVEEKRRLWTLEIQKNIYGE